MVLLELSEGRRLGALLFSYRVGNERMGGAWENPPPCACVSFYVWVSLGVSSWAGSLGHLIKGCPKDKGGTGPNFYCWT